MFGELLAEAIDPFSTRPIEIHDALSILERLDLHMDGLFEPGVTQNKSQVSSRIDMCRPQAPRATVLSTRHVSHLCSSNPFH